MRSAMTFGLCGALLASLPTGAAIAQETLKVGLLVSYSGPSGAAGASIDNTIKLYQKKYGDSVGGKKIEFVRRDTTGPNPEVARRLAQELITREKVRLLIGPDFTPNALAVAPLVTEARVPAIIAGAATQGVIEKSPYFLRSFYSIPQAARPMAQWATKNGIKKVVLLVADYGPGLDAQATFTKSFTDLGGTVTNAIKVPVRNPEFSGYIQRIKDADADAVMVFLPIGELPIQFLKAYSDAGLKSTQLKVLATGDVTDEIGLDAEGDTALNVVTTGFYSPIHDSPANKAFVGEYTALFGNTPRLGTTQVAVWDAMQIIYRGLEAQKGAPFDPDKFMATVRGQSFDSPRGPISLDKTSGDIVQNVYIRRVGRKEGILQNVEFDVVKDVPAR